MAVLLLSLSACHAFPLFRHLQRLERDKKGVEVDDCRQLAHANPFELLIFQSQPFYIYCKPTSICRWQLQLQLLCLLRRLLCCSVHKSWPKADCDCIDMRCCLMPSSLCLSPACLLLLAALAGRLPSHSNRPSINRAKCSAKWQYGMANATFQAIRIGPGELWLS